MNDVKVYPVSEDPETVAKIVRKYREATRHHEVEEYAHSLGLYPPGYTEGRPASISMYWPPGAGSQDGVPVWGVEGASAGDDPEDHSDDDDPWTGIVPIIESSPDSE